MATKNKTELIEARAREILAQVGIFDNPYFEALESGRMSKTAFAKSQAQFYFAVRFYSRPMGMLIARLPDSHERMGILHNLVDEHGSFDPSQSHQITFGTFLSSIGSKADEATAVSPA